MTSPKVHLAIDLGASSGRVLAGVVGKGRLDLDELNRFPNGPVLGGDGHYTWDFETLYANILEGIAKGASKYGEAVASMGVDTWGVDYGLLDAEGHLLSAPYAYRDPRTEGMQEEAARRVPRREIYEASGIQFMFFNTLNQLLAESMQEPGKLDRAASLLFTPDLINYRLCGRKANERTIASTSQLLNPRDGRWADDLIGRLGLPRRLFGDVVEPGTVLGTLTPALQRQLGAGPIQVIAVGAHDTASAIAAVPAEGAGHAYLSSGTWSLMGVEARAPVINDRSFEYSFTNEGGVQGTIRLLKNICGLWLVQECRRAWSEAGTTYPFEELTRMASEAPAFVSFIDPDSPEFANPCDMPAKIRAFCERTGQPVPQTPGEVVRTCHQSLAMRYRTVFSMLEDLQGRTLDCLHVVGGGCQNGLLNQFTADALKRKVIAGPVEATSAGNMLMQMLATGAIGSLAEGRALIRRSFDMKTFEPKNPAAWDAAWPRFARIQGAASRGA